MQERRAMVAIELRIRAAVLNGYNALGIPVTEPLGHVRPGWGSRASNPFAQQSPQTDPVLSR